MRVLRLVVLFALPAAAASAAAPASDQLLQAVRKGDVAAAKAALDAGVPVDAKFRYDRTALSFAADRGNVEIVTLLLERGADVNAKDTFYGVTPLVWAANNGHAGVARLLLARGATGAADVLDSGVEKKSLALVEAAIGSGKLTAEELSFALEDAERTGVSDAAAALRKAGAVPPPKAEFKVDPMTLAGYAGRYKDTAPSPQTVELSVADGILQATFGGGPNKLAAFDPVTFRLQDDGRVRLIFKVEDGRVAGFTLKQPNRERWFAREEAR
jgi:Ankyrin repeats (3 copies)/Ankyrin repeat